MKIIVNRGFDNMLTSIVVFKNGQPAIACPIQKDFCEMDAKEGDRIEVKLIALGMIAQRLAAFTYQEGKDTVYIRPTILCKRWEMANYRVLPYLSLLLLVLQSVTTSAACKWLCAGFLVLTALSWLSFQGCKSNPSMRSRLFTLAYL
ncbi:hypothetical protein [Alloprevotella tannerae]|uniref:hypothetical protein n=1 Tax=Alloprevotella tannerae TaxID=76122 RepID=UPI0028EDCCCB|nr:hypothetical protein [Alloprevotella tannerae]